MKINKISVLWGIVALCSGVGILYLMTNVQEDTSKKRIGIIQIIEHDCLDEARRGFVQGLQECGYTDGENIKIDYQNAQGDQSVCNSIANNFVGSKKDLVLAISTPAAQAISDITKDIPILITAVTEPQSCGLVDSENSPGGNVTGTSDLIPVDKQIGLIKKLLPHAQKVAVLYSSNEINSKYQAEMAKVSAKKLGMQTLDYTVSNSNELQQVCEHMDSTVDAVFVPTDNLVVACMPIVSKVMTSRKIPIICSESASVKNGALATYGIDYYELGKQTGYQASKILNNEAIPKDIPIEHAKQTKLSVNRSVLHELGIDLPSELQAELNF